jgi:hypothetical protein
MMQAFLVFSEADSLVADVRDCARVSQTAQA